MVIRLYGHTSKFFQLDGLLLFCIIMGLRSASSAKIVSVRELTGNTGTTSMWLFNMMDGKSGSFPFQVMTTATTLPDSAFYKINEKQNQIKINQLIMDLASNSLSIINQNIKIQLVDVKESYWWGHSKDGLKEYLFRRGGRGGLCFAIFCYITWT